MRKTIVGIIAVVALLLGAGIAQAQDVTFNVGTLTVSEWTTLGTTSWTVPAGVTSLQLLVVGGGGGGMGYGGGGGGGGFYSTGSYAVTPGSGVTVTVGAGGAGANRPADTGTYPNGAAASSGGQSVFDAVIAYGGQGGAVYWTSPGAVNTYGGTSGINNQNGVGGIVADFGGGTYNSGSGVGSKGLIGTSVAGGAGLSSAITGSTLWYAGGGGALVSGLGTDGGGNGSASSGTPGFAGAANTGGGGGAGWAAIGGAGGSGIVIVAYAAPIPEPSTWALVGLALVPLFFRRSRKSW